MFSDEQLAFEPQDILVMGHLCGSYDEKDALEMANDIDKMRENMNKTKVGRFLFVFHDIWTTHYAHVAKPYLKREGCVNGK